MNTHTHTHTRKLKAKKKKRTIEGGHCLVDRTVNNNNAAYFLNTVNTE